MVLHQRAMAACDVAPLLFNPYSGVSPIPRHPNAPELPYLKAETPKRSPAWGFYFDRRVLSESKLPRAMFDVPPNTPPEPQH